MIKVGDAIEWRGVSKTHRAVVVRDDGGELVAQLPNGKRFALVDLRYAKSAVLVRNEIK